MLYEIRSAKGFTGVSLEFIMQLKCRKTTVETQTSIINGRNSTKSQLILNLQLEALVLKFPATATLK